MPLSYVARTRLLLVSFDVGLQDFISAWLRCIERPIGVINCALWTGPIRA